MTEEQKPMSSEEAQKKSLERLRRSYFRRTNNRAAREHDAAADRWRQIDVNNNLAGAVAELWSPKRGAS